MTEQDWYEVEQTTKGEDDWMACSMIEPANTLVDIRIRLIRWIERIRDTDENEYRIVHKTLTTQVVAVVKGPETLRIHKDIAERKEKQ